MIRWTGLAPWEFESPFPGSLTSTFLVSTPKPHASGHQASAGHAFSGPMTPLMGVRHKPVERCAQQRPQRLPNFHSQPFKKSPSLPNWSISFTQFQGVGGGKSRSVFRAVSWETWKNESNGSKNNHEKKMYPFPSFRAPHTHTPLPLFYLLLLSYQKWCECGDVVSCLSVSTLAHFVTTTTKSAPSARCFSDKGGIVTKWNTVDESFCR